ncbi:Hydroxyacylglutathione hydrolase [Roseibacterium elongatum DSM 19469]|uniref:Hydroxyacylglutathione hydrolase n=1 Tax=Roseicyclus elongatus DSM 19469 TaxID=1294273 RepID=W8RT32_9RHOB|nr:hydroxyacylglutathione hydrolase [Roseibacterium elongatum]AHM04303.1 Hydroxyacylglutathione hydrolase [Roseibacterium elongatum DSM 19469]
MPEITPSAEIVTVPCLQDNYAFLLHDNDTGATALIDAPEADPIHTALEARGWTLTDILITHHHWDHVDAVTDLRTTTGARVWGARADAARLPPLDHALAEGDTVRIGALEGRVMDVSGHTVGHIAYHFPTAGAVFTADSLMALGCGRLFEGTAEQMWHSLSKLAALPPDTLVCSGHEYTQSNARFALTIDPENAALISRVEAIDRARAAGQATVPSILRDELATNPFLRASQPGIADRLGMANADPVSVFAEIRARKDRF